MKKKNGFIFVIVGSVITFLAFIFITFGILDAVKMSELRNTGLNWPGVILMMLILITGIFTLIVGIKKMRSKKEA